MLIHELEMSSAPGSLQRKDFRSYLCMDSILSMLHLHCRIHLGCARGCSC